MKGYAFAAHFLDVIRRHLYFSGLVRPLLAEIHAYFSLAVTQPVVVTLNIMSVFYLVDGLMTIDLTLLQASFRNQSLYLSVPMQHIANRQFSALSAISSRSHKHP